MQRAFETELAKYGPEQPGRRYTLEESRAYCRRLARRHYENFTVASRLAPAALWQHLANVYAWCRWADDLADEVDDAGRSEQLLDWWQAQLDACYDGACRHPALEALRDTINTFGIPSAPFQDLLSAFRQDCRVRRYATIGELLAYCGRSANPVGRIVLWLGRCHTPDRARFSDSICTGLQLANFCQDVASDWDRGRVYLPQEELDQHGYSEADFAARAYSAAFRGVMSENVNRAASFLLAGRPR
jgi:squalene synthase HpnC